MKLNYKRVMLVGFAFLIIQVFWMAYDAIVPLILVNKFGMNQTWSGLIMALDNILAVVLLPVFGSLSDKSNHKRGKRTPFIFVGTVLAVIAFFGLSFVDYAQINKLGEGAQAPGYYQATDESIAAQESFWDENYYITNNESQRYTDSVAAHNGMMDKENDEGEIYLKDYVARILYTVTSFDDLTDAQKENCREWYTNINFGSKFVLTDNTVTVGDKTLNVYDVYLLENGDEEPEEGKAKNEIIYKLTYSGDAAPVKELITFDNEDEQKVFEDQSFASAYTVLVNTARSHYARNITTGNPTTLILFMVVLLLTLVSMSIFRSPAVALMPDVVVRQQRSKGNAVINLMGTVGGMLALALGILFKTDNPENQIMSYMGYIGCVCLIMIVALVVFLLTVKEPKWAAEMEIRQQKYDKLDAYVAKRKAREAAANAGEEASKDTREAAAADPAPAKKKLSGSKLLSLILILASVAFWYMGYNAVTSKFSLYAINVLKMPFNSVLIVAQVVGIISFMPIGILSGRFGRKNMILFGVAMLFAAFVGAFFINEYTHPVVLYLLFSVAAIGWSAINVNSFPMVVELASGGDVGKYTGYYYTASMAAQMITPFLSGLIMDSMHSMRPLFIYGAIFVALSFVTMLFVKHGDSKPQAKKHALEYLDAGDD